MLKLNFPALPCCWQQNLSGVCVLLKAYRRHDEWLLGSNFDSSHAIACINGPHKSAGVDYLQGAAGHQAPTQDTTATKSMCRMQEQVTGGILR